MKFSQCLMTKYALDEHSFMLAIYPDKDTANKIIDFRDKLGIENADEMSGPDELHCTLRYYTSSDDKLKEKVLKWLNEDKVLDRMQGAGIIAGVSELDLLGDKNALVMKLHAKSLMLLQKILDGALQELGVEPSDYPSYRPHITLAYGPDNFDQITPDFEIILNRIAFVNNNKELWSKEF